LGHDSGGRDLGTLALGDDGSGGRLGTLALGDDGGGSSLRLLRLPELGLRLPQLRLERLGIHAGHDLPSLDNITVVDQHLFNAPRCFGGNVDLRRFDTSIAHRKVVGKASRRELTPGKDTAPRDGSHNQTHCEPCLPTTLAHVSLLSLAVPIWLYVTARMAAASR
jgi:hypothetical protein